MAIPFSTLKILFKVLFVFFAWLWLQGCSVNQYGIPGTVKLRDVSNSCGKRIFIEAVGIHIYTNPNIGIQLGYREAELFYPLVDDKSQGLEDRLCFEAFSVNDYCIHDKQERTQFVYNKVPMQINTQRIGIGLEITPYSISGNIGVNRKRVFQADSMDSFLFYYNNIDKTAPSICGKIIENKGD